MMKISLVKIRNNLFYFFLFLFIFTSINREFLPFGIDLRYICILLAIVLTLLRFFLKNKIYLNSSDFLLFLFFLDCFFCVGVSSFNDDIILVMPELINQFILYFSNFLYFIVFLLHKELINIKTIINYFMISMIILLISIIWLVIGKDLSLIYGFTDGIYSGFEHFNLFGMNSRFAGYADDPNYACLFSIIGFFLVVQYKHFYKKKKYYSNLLVCFLTYAFSLSKTLTLGIIMILILNFITKFMKLNHKFKLLLNIIIMNFIIFIPILLVKTNYFSSLTTMSTRISMWKMGIELFFNSFLIGQGLTAFRCVYNQKYFGKWYVQSHSTFIQILSEQGIIGIVLFASYIISILKKNEMISNILILLYLFFAINFETVYLQIFILLVYVIPSRNLNYEN